MRRNSHLLAQKAQFVITTFRIVITKFGMPGGRCDRRQAASRAGRRPESRPFRRGLRGYRHCPAASARGNRPAAGATREICRSVSRRSLRRIRSGYSS